MFEQPSDQQQQPTASPQTPTTEPMDLASELQKEPVTVGDMYAMPEKFLSSTAMRVPAAQGRKTLLIVGVIVALLAALGAGAFWDWQRPGSLLKSFLMPTKSESTNTNQTNVNSDTTTNTNTNANTQVSDGKEKERDTQRMADLITIGKALDEYHKRFGSFPQLLDVIPKDILPQAPTDPLTKAPYTYSPIEDRQSYKIAFDVESEMRTNYQVLGKGSWGFSQVDYLKITNQEVVPPTPPIIPEPLATSTAQLGNIDSDGDGLTAAEEKIFKTSPSSSDTDNDGFVDNAEITNFYSPIQSGAIKLDAAGLVTLYTNPTYKFSFYYPSDWVVNVPQNDTTVTMVTAAPGTDFSVTVSDNANTLTSWEWYSQNVSHDFNKNNINVVKVAGHEAIRTLDGLSVYVSVGTKMYVLRYNVSEGSTIDYPNIFSLFLNRLAIPTS